MSRARGPKPRRFVQRHRLTAIHSDGGAFFVHPSRRCCCIRRMLSSAFSSVSKGRPLCSCHMSSSQSGSIRFFDDRRPCVCSSFLRRCSNCFFTEIDFSNSGPARAKLNSAVPGGALQVPRSRWPRWFRCSHVSLCCSSLLSRCSYRFFTWAPFHSGRGWPPTQLCSQALPVRRVGLRLRADDSAKLPLRASAGH